MALRNSPTQALSKESLIGLVWYFFIPLAFLIILIQPTFLDYAQQSALRSAVGFGVGTTILGQDVGDALASSGRGFVAGTVGGFAARSTGKLHLGGDINALTQLGFHAAIGGGMGAILNGDWESGAIRGFLEKILF